jgi:ribosomal protein S27AE
MGANGLRYLIHTSGTPTRWATVPHAEPAIDSRTGPTVRSAIGTIDHSFSQKREVDTRSPPPGQIVDTRHMRNTHSCPKCRSTVILKIPGKAGAYGVGNNIQMGWSNFSAILVTRYLCGSCGFSEEWVDDKAGLAKLSAKYYR